MIKIQNLHQGQEDDQISNSGIISQDDEDFLNEDEAAQEASISLSTMASCISQENKFAHSFKEPKNIELMYILFTFYRHQLLQIAHRHKCEFKISLKMYNVGCYDADIKQQFEECSQQIQKKVSTIKYCPLFAVETKNNVVRDKEKYKFFSSDYINKKAEQKGMRLVLFNSEIYVFSDSQTEKELINNAFKLSRIAQIFTVKFANFSNRIDQKIQKNKFVLNNKISEFLQRVIEYYKPKFEQRNIIVEVNRYKNAVYLIGEQAKDLMAGKTTIRNVLESMVIMCIKNTVLEAGEEKGLSKYLGKVSNYPIYYSRMSSFQVVFISKDNILRQLLQKPNIKTKLGIAENSDFGIHLLRSYTMNQKIEIIDKVCKDKGYDTYYYQQIRYFRKMFMEEGEEHKIDVDEIMKILTLVIEQLSENKEKHQIIVSKKREDEINLKNLEAKEFEYLIISSKRDQVSISKLLKRDVLVEDVQMKKKYIVEYNVVEGKAESGICWVIDQKNLNNVVEIEKSNMKGPGKYARGKKKISNNQDATVYLMEELITIL